MLGKQSREFHCSRVFENAGKTLALVYEILLESDLKSTVNYYKARICAILKRHCVSFVEELQVYTVYAVLYKKFNFCFQTGNYFPKMRVETL